MTSSDPYGPPQKRSADAELPKFPGERPQQHAGTAWKEIASSRLGAQQLLAVAHGREPAQAAVIIDEPLLPILAPGHRDHERRVETNNRIGTQNKRNSIRRWYITMGAYLVCRVQGTVISEFFERAFCRLSVKLITRVRVQYSGL